jgi:dolichol-phosphate mannosyltransferase
VLEAMGAAGFRFLPAQTIATLAAMTLNYIINNNVTYRSQRLKGRRFIIGYFIFCAVCAVGGFANLGVANLVLSGYGSWPLAGIAGALMSAVFNFGAATQLVWAQRRKTRRPIVRTTAAA